MTKNDEIINFLKLILQPIISDIVQESLKKYLPIIRENDEKAVRLTITEAEYYINRKVSTIYVLVSKSIIPYHKNGKKLWFDRTKLDQWLIERDNNYKQQQGDFAKGYFSNKKVRSKCDH